ncbi:MAG: hypothetical protein JWM57_4186 [Phycisphaerales bacterium]|nr:hypothetical protein [Phycisphaerales bacterium]
MPIDFQTFATGATRFSSWRGGLLAWPKWARVALLVPMIPGILLVVLSILIFIVSLLTLFVLTAPVYALLDRLFAGQKSDGFPRSPGSKRVEAVIRDA